MDRKAAAEGPMICAKSPNAGEARDGGNLLGN